jgi:hypothetical protein
VKVVTAMAERRGFGNLGARRIKPGNEIVSWRVRFWGPDGERYSKSFGDRLSAETFAVEERSSSPAASGVRPTSSALHNLPKSVQKARSRVGAAKSDTGWTAVRTCPPPG